MVEIQRGEGLGVNTLSVFKNEKRGYQERTQGGNSIRIPHVHSQGKKEKETKKG